MDPNKTITVGYDGQFNFPTINSGIEFNGTCYQYRGGVGNLVDAIAHLDLFVDNVCSTNGCVCPSPTPTITNTQSVSVTPTNTSTPTVTPTNTVTQSETPTNTPTVSVTVSETPTNTPTITTTPTITPTLTLTGIVNFVIYELSGVCESTTINLFVSSNVSVGNYIAYSGKCYVVNSYSTETPTDTIEVEDNEIYNTESECVSNHSCVTPTPTPSHTTTPTPTVDNTPAVTPTQTYTPTTTKATVIATIQSCCSGGTTYQISVIQGSTIGQSLLYSGSCFNIISLPSGPTTGLVYYDLSYDNCTECANENGACPTPTPTTTPVSTVTPTYTPNVTPAFTSTPSPTQPIDG